MALRMAGAPEQAGGSPKALVPKATGGLGILHELRLQMGVVHDGGELVVQQVIVQRPAGLFVEQQLLRQAVADGHGHTAVDLRLCQRRVHQACRSRGR